ncbi:MAG: ribbon-helix-helix protein, CopG family [Nanoarchaeota archaeon]
MKATISLDENAEKELDELQIMTKSSKSELIRNAIRDFYFKEMRAKKNTLFFLDMYNKGVLTKDTLFLLLPRLDAEAIIIGSKTGKEAVKIATKLGY